MIAAVAVALLAPQFGFATQPADSGTPATLEEIRHWNQVGQSGEAERAARAMLREAERVHGPESAEAAEILDELATALRRGGKATAPEALEVCERALRIKKPLFGVNDPRYATSLYNLGLLYLARKDYKRARTILGETLEIRRRALGSNHPDVAKSLLALGSANHDLGNYAEGLALTEQAVAIEEVALGAENPERAQGLMVLAVARYSTGDFSGSIPLFEKAAGLWERSPTPNRGVIAACYHNLGAVYVETGDYVRAIDVLGRALRLREELFGANHPLVAATLSVLGSALRHRGDLGGAKARYERAVWILEAAAPNDPDLGWYRATLGWVYLEEGDQARAKDAFTRALHELEAAVGVEHPDLWMSLRGLAMVARNRGETEAARNYYERALSLVRKASGPNHPDFGRTLAEYASFKLETGDSIGALDTALAAASVNREHLRITARGIGERQALLYASTMETGLDVAFQAISGSLGSRSSDLVPRVWDALVRSRALILDEVAERSRLVGGAGEVLEGAKQLEGARNRLANLLVRGASGETPERDRVLVARAREEVERAELDLAARSASFRRDQDRATLGWDQIMTSLPSGSGLVSFIGYREGRGRSLLAFVLGTDRSPKVVGLGSAKEIDRLVQRWRNLAGTPPSGLPRELAAAESACRTAGQALRARIWDPLADLLVGSKLIFVVPDGSLHLVNLVALPSPGGGGYLIESAYAIHYLSAERDIVTTGGTSPRGTGLLALGGASFDKRETLPSRDSTLSVAAAASPADLSAGDVYREGLSNCEGFRTFRFEPLPETVTEIDEITRSWGRRDEVIVLEGQNAGERSVKALLPGRRVAHFATHGFFLDKQCGGSSAATARGIGGISQIDAPHSATQPSVNPFLLAGLALAGANRRDKVGPGEEDGILTAEEIASLDLSGLDWVVLSACDTGIGDVQSGEGVLGLRRAFEVAGARTLIMSLWAVGDRTARDWMGFLYEARFRRNLETAEAVREADLAVLKSLRANGRSTHPFYWAGFVATGGWR